MNTALQNALSLLASEIISTTDYFKSEAEITMDNVLLVVNGLEIKHGRACRAPDYPMALRLANVLEKLFVAAANDPPPFFPNSRRGRRDIRVRMIQAFGPDSSQSVQDPAELLSLCLDDAPLKLQVAQEYSESPNPSVEQIRQLMGIKERVAQLKRVYDKLPADYQLIVDPWLKLRFGF